MPTATEDEIGWKLVEEMSIKAAELLKPIFDAQGGRNGRLSVQTDPRLYRDADAIVEQAVRFAALAPNIIVKIPVTAAGVAAIEEATYRGISINATVSFSLPQASPWPRRSSAACSGASGKARHRASGLGLHADGRTARRLAEARRRQARHQRRSRRARVGRRRRLQEGLRLYQERGYRMRLLSAAFRNHMHWSEFIGGDVVISPPHKWQVRFNASDIDVVSRIDVPVDAGMLATLDEVRGLPSRLRRRRASRSRTSTPSVRPGAPCASSSAPAAI